MEIRKKVSLNHGIKKKLSINKHVPSAVSSLQELQQKLELSKVKRIDDVPFEDIILEENQKFYRSVTQFKMDENPDIRSSVDARNKILEISTLYLEPGAKFEINIPGKDRKELLDQIRTLENGYPPQDIFDKAQNEIYDLMLRDNYPKFLATLKKTNLSDKLSTEAVIFGLRLLFSGFVIFLLFWFLQIYADRQLEERSSQALETLNDRKWRVLGFPLMYAGIGFFLAGRSHLCSICSTLGSNYTYSNGKPSYSNLIVDLLKNTIQVKLRMKDSLPGRFTECKACVSTIEKANRDKGNKNAIMNFLLAALLFTILLLLPPNNPEWFD